MVFSGASIVAYGVFGFILLAFLVIGKFLFGFSAGKIFLSWAFFFLGALLKKFWKELL
jgi:hypothetical protein